MMHSLPHGLPKSTDGQALLASYDVKALAREDCHILSRSILRISSGYDVSTINS